MAGFEPFRDMTSAERAVWEQVKRNSGREAGRVAHPEQARQLIQVENRAAVDRANEGGRGD